MAFDELRLLQEAGAAFVPEQDPEPARDLAERERGDRSVRLAERAEQLALADRAAGGPLGELPRARAKFDACRDEVDELEAKLARARARMESARSSVQFWQDRLTIADESVARSRALDPLEVASARAADELRKVREGKTLVERARRQLRHGVSR